MEWFPNHLAEPKECLAHVLFTIGAFRFQFGGNVHLILAKREVRPDTLFTKLGEPRMFGKVVKWF